MLHKYCPLHVVATRISACDLQAHIRSNKAAQLPIITNWTIKVKIFNANIYPANILWQIYFKVLFRLDQFLMSLPHIF
jgi:hypothetical protein